MTQPTSSIDRKTPEEEGREVRNLYEPADIDSSKVEMLPDNRALFAFRVVLSGTPDPLWARTFEEIWKESRYLNKLDARVIGETIRFICKQSQGMEDYLFLIESRIEATNKRMEQYWESAGFEVKRLKYHHYPESFVPFGVF